MAISWTRRLVISSVIVLLAALYGLGVYRWLTVLGFLRLRMRNTPFVPNDQIIFSNTARCEDIHYFAPANKIITVCEDEPDVHFRWLPPMGNFDDAAAAQRSRATIHVIDPLTMEDQRLTYENWDQPFPSHGIDVIADPDEQGSVFIFVINHAINADYLDHLAQPGYFRKWTSIPKEISAIEVFHHHFGTTTARHVRTIKHPLITTPNDILAISPTAFYVTNDHYYREGLLRQLEDAYWGAKWSNTIYIEALSETDGRYDVQAHVAIDGLHNNNGLGHGNSLDEVVIVSAASGQMHLTRKEANHTLTLTETAFLDSTLDNPTYFSDPYGNQSGYVLGGLAQAGRFNFQIRNPMATDPCFVWLLRPKSTNNLAAENYTLEPRAWEKRLLFSDDGRRIRSCSTGLLVAIDPARESGRRKAWLFITGPLSDNILAVKVDL